MSSVNLRDKAFSFFRDKKLTDKWLETPCISFGGQAPSDYWKSSSKAQKDIENYFDELLNRKTKESKRGI